MLQQFLFCMAKSVSRKGGEWDTLAIAGLPESVSCLTVNTGLLSHGMFPFH